MVWSDVAKFLGLPLEADELEESVPTGFRPVRTEFSATVFTGEPEAWVAYLGTPRESRYDADLAVEVRLTGAVDGVPFLAENDDSRDLAGLLLQGLADLLRELRGKSDALASLRELVLENPSNQRCAVRLRTSRSLPSRGTREVQRDTAEPVAYVVSQRALVDEALAASLALGKKPKRIERLAAVWPLLRRIIADLAMPNEPRDRFVTKIAINAKLAFVSLHLLHDGRAHGRLVPSEVGALVRRDAAKKLGCSEKQLADHHPYFHMMEDLSFMLRGGPYAAYERDAQVSLREYLDDRYLRLSLSGVMPSPLSYMAPMRYSLRKGAVRTERPEVGRFGVRDQEDLSAWKEVNKPFQEMGFTLLSQLGMGEFGRVYLALNGANSRLPPLVALKVDRIIGKKKNAIAQAEKVIDLGRRLAFSPHVMRVYDGGKLPHSSCTYHVLQYVNGDTLDHLLGVAGLEHASMRSGNPSSKSKREVQARLSSAMNPKGSEEWRQGRSLAPFTDALSLMMVLDLFTSVFLWLEEVHGLGYAINDLKNGNLMMSRRGALKGIDLDDYSVARCPEDLIPDFVFLGVSLLFLYFQGPRKHRVGMVKWEELMQDEQSLREGLERGWGFGDVEVSSRGRVRREEVIDLFYDLINRCRRQSYLGNPAQFSADVERLIALKRRIFLEEIVLD